MNLEANLNRYLCKFLPCNAEFNRSEYTAHLQLHHRDTSNTPTSTQSHPTMNFSIYPTEVKLLGESSTRKTDSTVAQTQRRNAGHDNHSSNIKRLTVSFVDLTKFTDGDDDDDYDSYATPLHQRYQHPYESGYKRSLPSSSLTDKPPTSGKQYGYWDNSVSTRSLSGQVQSTTSITSKMNFGYDLSEFELDLPTSAPAPASASGTSVPTSIPAPAPTSASASASTPIPTPEFSNTILTDAYSHGLSTMKDRGSPFEQVDSRDQPSPNSYHYVEEAIEESNRPQQPKQTKPVRKPEENFGNIVYIKPKKRKKKNS
ncbi:hypothetical protein BCR42DRAFT_71891 [Absidia repens]|uniref:Uncharacterized protein n=1 Tax=Absidia repens TaxID=90262 RepID=A0A1X2IB66_9FUNG|nr:hypothetical protein BCR42DRAFT_71891 [Absidia repens]